MSNNNTTIRISTDLKQKLKDYSKLLSTEKKKISQVDILNDIITDFFKDKILSNDYIELEKPFYFNFNELVNCNNVLATTKQPLTNLDDIIVVNKIPINLDTFSEELKTYCYNDIQGLHRGITTYLDLDWDLGEEIRFNKDYHLIFEYDASKEVEYLTIGIIDYKEIGLYLPKNSNTTELLFLEMQKRVDAHKQANKDTNNSDLKNFLKILNTMDVVAKYKHKKRADDFKARLEETNKN